MTPTPSLLLKLRYSVELDLRHARRLIARRLADLALVFAGVSAYWRYTPVPTSNFWGTAYLLGYVCAIVLVIVAITRVADSLDAMSRRTLLRNDLRAFCRTVWLRGDALPKDVQELFERVNAEAKSGAPIDVPLLSVIEKEIAAEQAVFASASKEEGR